MSERWFTDSRCQLHEAPRGYPERPARLATILARGVAEEKDVVDGADTADQAAGERARPAVGALHDRGYIARLEAAVARGDGVLDSADNPICAGTWDAAWAAAGAAVRAAEWAVESSGRHAFAAVRPPGHHAERDRAMGFCFFANIAVAAQHLVDRHGLERLAIVDFDVHHGNGTQHLFERRADVLFISLHQWPFYPGTGAGLERGEGAGAGATVNVPLPAGTGDDGYAEAFRQQVLPALDAHRPQALLVSAGFDAWQDDPLGGMRVTLAGYRQWGTVLADAADRLCQGRMVSMLEGGYDVARLGDLVCAYLDGVAGRPRTTA